MKLINLFLYSLLLLLASCTPYQEECPGFIKNYYGQSVSLPKYNQTITYFLHKDTTKSEEKEILEAANEWNQLFQKDVIIIDTLKRADNFSPSNSNVIYITKEWKENPGEQGRTLVRFVGSDINFASIIINKHNFHYEGKEKNTSKVSLKSLMIHEFGHALGLTHNDREISTMNTYLDFNTERGIKLADIKNLSCQYQLKKPANLLSQNIDQ